MTREATIDKRLGENRRRSQKNNRNVTVISGAAKYRYYFTDLHSTQQMQNKGLYWDYGDSL